MRIHYETERESLGAQEAHSNRVVSGIQKPTMWASQSGESGSAQYSTILHFPPITMCFSRPPERHTVIHDVRDLRLLCASRTPLRSTQQSTILHFPPITMCFSRPP